MILEKYVEDNQCYLNPYSDLDFIFQEYNSIRLG